MVAQEKSITRNDLPCETPADGGMRRAAAHPLLLGEPERIREQHGGGASPPDRRHENQHTPMKTRTFASKTSRMDADAYAGFLKLWLTPAHKVPAITPEVEAYLRFANQAEPLNETSRDALCQPARRAA
jgi:hypothetical protein